MSSLIFTQSLSEQTPLSAAITHAYRQDETACVEALIKKAELSQLSLEAIQKMAHKLVIEVRRQRLGKGGVDAFMYEYDLSSEEGIALMCLAEALLRIPDKDTVDKLIRDKLASADWAAHLGQSESYLVNAASWSLMLTGKILNPKESANYFGKVLKKFVERTSEPVIRKAVAEAMKILGKQFVMGRTIDEALKRSKDSEKLGYSFSYDMLGEAARTAEDADRYFASYQQAIKAVGEAANSKGFIKGPGISVKLSALYPRYEMAQRDRAVAVLTERLRALAIQAKHFDIGLTVDAEEADRLEMSLDILEAVSGDPALKGWGGFGLALQAYQKRAIYVIDWLADVAQRHKRRWMVRLVKGAYWDYEIKDSQVRGLESYPVFTRKVSTDVSYLACAKRLLENKHLFYPQFATHNAYKVAAVLEMAGKDRDFEFQCLKGMGNALYDQVVTDKTLNVACRIYAPVGQHRDLLPYLVRRLLENGANSSFVNRIVDETVPIEELIADPVAIAKALPVKPHARIPLPQNIYGDRKNSKGIDLSNVQALRTLATSMEKSTREHWSALPLMGKTESAGERHAIVSPTNTKNVVGEVIYATKEDLEVALKRATKAAVNWDKTPIDQRATILERIADLFEAHYAELMAITVFEAGKNIPDAVSEIREAVDFCRYYAQQARQSLSPKAMPGPTGEFNQLSMHGRGIILCISPWNFPLAIFTGQVVAALVAGNCVLAKPAEQTSLIAAKAVKLMYGAGIPEDVLHLLPGKGEIIGAAAVEDIRINGVMFTGSTEVAKAIQQTLANRKGPIVPLIAETGGQNAMIADSTALTEQLVMDAISSAFGSAGQRCSALRVLFLQEEIADRVMAMLKGAMAELKVGDPALLTTDVGPVIDSEARANLEAHAEYLNQEGKLIYQIPLAKDTQYGTFFAPRVYEIPNLKVLKREVFGPILHIIRYRNEDLDKIITQINSTGYGLTLGIQTRIDATAEYIQQRVHVGNVYVNRNMIGAVVGVQPFGGEGLSGTGPKAGGPHYLARLCHERTLTINTTAAGGNASLMALEDD